jgi:protein-disulfide isomerase
MKSYIWIGSVVIVLVALMFLSVRNTGPTLNFEVNKANPLDNIKGNASATVSVIEYSDFQCPACRSYYLVMRQMQVEFGEEVLFVFRNFPLSNIHANTEFAARAAEAAGKQGKFWEMHDLLFEKQDEWARVANVEPIFESYADLIGININQFTIDWQSKDVKEFVAAQKNSAEKLGLQGTPTFFVNGKQIQNPTSITAFREIINTALKSE